MYIFIIYKDNGNWIWRMHYLWFMITADYSKSSSLILVAKWSDECIIYDYRWLQQK